MNDVNDYAQEAMTMDQQVMADSMVAVRAPAPVTVQEFEAAVSAKAGQVAATREQISALEEEVCGLAVAGEPTTVTRGLLTGAREDLEDLKVQLDALRAGMRDAEARAEREGLERDVRAFYASMGRVLRARAAVLAARETLASRESDLADLLRREGESLLPGRGVLGEVRAFRRAITDRLTSAGATVAPPAGVLNDGGDTAAEVLADAERFERLARVEEASSDARRAA